MESITKARALREAQNLTQEEAADRIGCSPSYLSRFERGYAPDEGSRTLRKIERFYRAPLDTPLEKVTNGQH